MMRRKRNFTEDDIFTPEESEWGRVTRHQGGFNYNTEDSLQEEDEDTLDYEGEI